MIKGKEKGKTIGRAEINILVNGKMIYLMERVLLHMLMVVLKKEFGKKVI